MLQTIWAASAANKIDIAPINSDVFRTVTTDDLASKVATLESSIKRLDSSFGRIEIFLFIATALVVIGLIVEYWDDVRSLRQLARNRRTGLSIGGHGETFGRALRAVVGGILVTIGVGWELVEEVQGYRVETEAADDNKIVVGLLTDEARAAEEKIAGATRDAEYARLEQERLKQLVKWRTVDPANVKALVKELSKGSGEIDLVYAPGDPEAEYFALKIIGNDGFAAANNSSGRLKWHVFLRPWISNGMFFGISIPGPENDEVKVLRRAFSVARIEFSTESPPEEVLPPVGPGLKYTPPPKHAALIVIGLRKPPL